MSALYNGRKGDRPPAGNPTSIVCHGLMDAAGVSFPEAHVDANAMADLALAGHEILGFDTVMPEYSVHQESAALGCDVDWGDRDTMPDSKTSPYADFSDIQIPENILEKPPMRVVLDALSILRHNVGDKVAIIGKVMGPWTLSYHMAGTQNFLLLLELSSRQEQTCSSLRIMSPEIWRARTTIRNFFCLFIRRSRHRSGDRLSFMSVETVMTAWSYSQRQDLTYITLSSRWTPR
jgi:MtaA/CmuA family methyltransferase